MKCYVKSCLGNVIGPSTFRIPREPETRSLWIKVLVGVSESDNVRVCSNHFKNEDFKDPESPSKGLNPGAVPSLQLSDCLCDNAQLLGELAALKISFAEKITRCVELEAQHQFALDAARSFRDQILQIKKQNESLAKELREQQLQFDELSCYHRALLEVHSLCKITKSDQQGQLMKYRKDGSASESIIRDLQQEISRLKEGKDGGTRIRRRWTEEDISFGLGIYSAGAAAYRTLIKLSPPFSYPAPSTIRKWVSGVEFDEGHLNIVYNLLKSLDLNENERKCVLMLDEMGLKRMYDYDRVNDRVLGPSTNVQVMMIRGLFKSWKQPIFYKYKENATKELFLETIRKLHYVGIAVVAIVCDQGSSNVKAMAELTSNSTHFKHPCNDSLIHTFHDTPHMIKLLRNYLLDGGYVHEDKKYTREPIEQFHMMQKGLTYKLAPKFTDLHLYCVNMQRQKVKLATQLFSNTVSMCLKMYGSNGSITAPDWLNVSELCQLIDKWFDIFNSDSKFSSNSIAGAYGTDLINQDKVLDEMKDFMTKARVLKRNKQSSPDDQTVSYSPKSTLMAAQKAVIHNIDSLRSLYTYLKVDYILVKRLNQDPLENLFGLIRSKGGANEHPNQMQFKCLLRSLILGKEGYLSDDSNVEGTTEMKLTDRSLHTIDVQPKQAPKQKFVCDQAISSTQSQSNSQGTDILSSFPTDFAWKSDTSNDIEEQALRYVGGYLIKTVKKKNPNKDLSEYIKLGEGSDFVHLISRGGLIPIEDFFYEELVKLDNLVNKFNGDEFDFEPKYLARLKSETMTIKIDDEMITLFLRCKMYFKIRYLNQKMQDHQKAKRRKLSKFE